MTVQTFVYNYAQNANQPPSGNINQGSSALDTVSVSFTDSDGTDNTNFLSTQVEVNDTITLNDVVWTITAITLKGSNVAFTVTPTVAAPPFGSVQVTFTTAEAGTDEARQITSDDVGVTIAQNGVLNSVTFVTPSTGDYHDTFSLVDDSFGEVNLFTVHPAMNGISPGVVFPVGTSFVNLTVKDAPMGCVFAVDYTES